MSHLPVQLNIGFLLERILCNGLEGLLDIDGFLSRCLKITVPKRLVKYSDRTRNHLRDIAFGLAEGHGTLLRDLNSMQLAIINEEKVPKPS